MAQWSKYRALSCLGEAKLALENDGRGTWHSAVCLPKSESLDGSLTWRNKVEMVGAVLVSA